MGRGWSFIASVAHLSKEKQLDIRVLHGNGTDRDRTVIIDTGIATEANIQTLP